MICATMVCVTPSGAGPPVPSHPSTGGAEASLDEGAAPSRSSSTTTITARIRPKRVRAGDAFTVEVVAHDASNVSAIFFHLVFDPALVVPVPDGFAEGGWFHRNHATTRFLARPASSGERILVGLARLGPGGAGGAGVVCRLTFRALAAGDTALAFDRAGLTSPGGAEIPSRFNGSTLKIRSAPGAGAP